MRATLVSSDSFRTTPASARVCGARSARYQRKHKQARANVRNLWNRKIFNPNKLFLRCVCV